MPSQVANGVPRIAGRVQFTDFRPDADPIEPGALLDCHNVYPTAKGYRSYPSLALYSSNGLPSTCTGTFGGLLNGEFFIFAGVSAQIYQLIGFVLTSAGLTLSASLERWRFTAYGAEIIATDSINPMQAFDGTSWAALGGSPPVMSIVAASNYSLFAIEVNSAKWWSTLASNIWTPSVSTACVTDTIDETPGWITAAHKLRAGMVLYKRNAIHMGSWIDPPFFWDFHVVSEQVGAPSHEAVANLGDVHIWPGPDDFWMFDGYKLSRVPNNLKEWFFSYVNQRNDFKIAARYDQVKSLVFWHFQSVYSEGPLDAWICFNLRTGKWAKGMAAIDMPVFSAMPTADGNYLAFQQRYATYGDLSGLYGDLVSRTTDVSGAILTANHALYTYSGFPEPAYVTTHDFGDRQGMYFCNRVRPAFAIEPVSGASITIMNQYNPGTTPVAKPAVMLSSDGWFNVLNTARLQRMKILAFSEMEITGVDAQIAYRGRR